MTTTTELTTLNSRLPTPSPGVHRRVPAASYHAWRTPSNSMLGHLARSPAHYRWAMDHPGLPTPEMEFGTAFHTAVLEPDLYAVEYIRGCRCSAVLKTGKRAGQQCESDGIVYSGGEWFCGTHAGDRFNDPDGPTVLTEDDVATLDAMVASIRSHGWAGPALALPGESELSIVFDDAATGIRCKVRADRIARSGRRGCVIDLKTTKDASPDDFARTIHQRGYHRQAALYLRACAAVGIDVEGFIILAIEKTAPFAVNAVQLDDDAIEVGGREVDRLLALWAECEASGNWPGYGGGELLPMGLPAWARKRDELLIESV